MISYFNKLKININPYNGQTLEVTLTRGDVDSHIDHASVLFIIIILNQSMNYEIFYIWSHLVGTVAVSLIIFKGKFP